MPSCGMTRTTAYKQRERSSHGHRRFTETRRLAREELGSAGAQEPCWGAGLSLALLRLSLPRQPHLLLRRISEPTQQTHSKTHATPVCPV